MTKFKLVLVAMFAATALMAQDFVYLYYNNGKVDEVAVSDFDSLSFTKPKPATTGEAEITGGTKVKWVQLWENGPKFAEYNVGATSVGEYGGYYAWGGSQDKVDDHYTGEGDIQGGNYDTAKNLWGDNWQMPTSADYEALLANCDVAWKSEDESGYGVAGRLYTGRDDYAGNSVFFPAAGFYYNGEVDYAGSSGYYWSSTPDDSVNAYSLFFGLGLQLELGNDRYYGSSVRAVLK